MFSLVFRDHSPFPLCRGVCERGFERFNGCHFDWRPIDERDHRSIAAPVENFVQAGPQGAELPARRIRINYQRRSVGINDGSQRGFILADYDQHDVNVGKEKPYGGG